MTNTKALADAAAAYAAVVIREYPQAGDSGLTVATAYGDVPYMLTFGPVPPADLQVTPLNGADLDPDVESNGDTPVSTNAEPDTPVSDVTDA